MHCGEIVRRLGRSYADRPMAVYGDETLTGGELFARACRFAQALLAEGLEPQDRVATLGPNSRRSLEEVGGLALGGFTRVPLHYGAAADVIAHMLADSGARVLIADAEAYAAIVDGLGPLPDLQRVILADDSGTSEYDRWLAAAPPVDPEVPLNPEMMIQLGYTGGTTGRPKGAVVTHGSWVRVTAENSLAVAPLGEADGYLAAAPMAAAAGSYLFPMWAEGVVTYVARDFSPAALATLIRRHRPTIALMLPPVVEALLAEPSIEDADLVSLRTVLTMGAALRLPAIDALRDRLGDILTLVYGQSEALPVTMLRPVDFRRAAAGRPEIYASVGRPTPSSRVSIVDDTGCAVEVGALGNLLVDTPGNMARYWRAPDASAEKVTADGWIRTGDVGYVDSEGYLFLAGRSDDVIRTADGLVVPQPVERVFEAHPDVVEAAVVGVPDASTSGLEHPRAVVVVRDRAGVAGPESLRRWAADHEEAALLPADLDVVVQAEPLPKSHVGKLLRRVVKEQQG